ncbi:unnamed protein product [Chrysoparadoxa australica]
MGPMHAWIVWLTVTFVLLLPLDRGNAFVVIQTHPRTTRYNNVSASLGPGWVEWESGVKVLPTISPAANPEVTTCEPHDTEIWPSLSLHDLEALPGPISDSGGGGGGRGGGDDQNGKGRGDDQDGRASGAGHGLLAVWSAYVRALESWPLVTKCLTAGLIAALGDVIAQALEASHGPLSYDRLRGMAVVIDAVLLTAPMLHTAYALLEHLVPSGPMINACFHVFCDTFLLDPLFVGVTMFNTGLLERRSIRKEIVPQFGRDYGSAVRGCWGVSLFFWPITAYSFRYLPLKFRVMVVNCCDVLWDVSLSMSCHKGRMRQSGMA